MLFECTSLPSHNKPSVSMLSFRELHCVPDVWSLIEWSNVLTPRNFRRRYDTVFYLCCSEDKPPASPDNAEVIKAKVSESAVVVQK